MSSLSSWLLVGSIEVASLSVPEERSFSRCEVGAEMVTGKSCEETSRNITEDMTSDLMVGMLVGFECRRRTPLQKTSKSKRIMN